MANLSPTPPQTNSESVFNDIFAPINQQNVNVNGPLLFGEATKLDAGWAHDVGTNSFSFAGAPRKLRVYVKCHQKIPETANSQRPSPMLFLDRTNIVDGTPVTETVDCSANGYIRDTSDVENSSNGIVFPDMNPGENPVYTVRAERDSTITGAVEVIAGYFAAESFN